MSEDKYTDEGFDTGSDLQAEDVVTLEIGGELFELVVVADIEHDGETYLCLAQPDGEGDLLVVRKVGDAMEPVTDEEALQAVQDSIDLLVDISDED